MATWTKRLARWWKRGGRDYRSEELNDLRDLLGSGATCKKCGRPKPRMDSTPCYRCVLENMAEAERVHDELTAK